MGRFRLEERGLEVGGETNRHFVEVLQVEAVRQALPHNLGVSLLVTDLVSHCWV